MKVKTDTFSRKFLKPLFNSIANSPIGGGIGIIGPHENHETELLLAKQKPIVLLYEYIDEEDSNLINFFENDLEAYEEALEETALTNIKQRYNIKTAIKHLRKSVSNTKKLEEAVKSGSILKKEYRTSDDPGCEEHEDYLEEYYYLPGQEANVDMLIQATKANNTNHFPKGKELGHYLGYSDRDIEKFNKRMASNEPDGLLDDKINSVKRWCLVKSLLIQ